MFIVLCIVLGMCGKRYDMRYDWVIINHSSIDVTKFVCCCYKFAVCTHTHTHNAIGTLIMTNDEFLLIKPTFCSKSLPNNNICIQNMGVCNYEW